MEKKENMYHTRTHTRVKCKPPLTVCHQHLLQKNFKIISAETPLEPVKDIGDSHVATPQQSLNSTCITSSMENLVESVSFTHNTEHVQDLEDTSDLVQLQASSSKSSITELE